MENVVQFIKPELMVLAAVGYIIGIFLKKSETFQDKQIPLVLTAICVVISLFYVFATSDIANLQNVLMAIFTGVTQGVLCAAAPVYINQVIKQSKNR